MLNFNLKATRPARRLLLVVCAVGALVFLSLVFEPRRRALNCRNFWTCFSPSSPYNTSPAPDSLDIPPDQQVVAVETTLADGTVRFHRKVTHSSQSVLFLVLTRDGTSWSRDFQSTRRSVYDFLDLVARTALPARSVALSLLTGSAAEYQLLKQATDEIPLGRVTVFHRNDTGASFSYQDRHRPEVQNERRAAVARTRNYLMSRALMDEPHVVWVDADVVDLSPGVIQTMVRHAETRPDVGVITARCEQNEMDNYDKNAWAVVGPGGGGSQLTLGADRERAKEELERHKKLVPELIQGTRDADLVPLDSVGGTLLYLRADLIRQGLVFPWWTVVGTEWEKDGWVGLETEGLCYLSKRMEGGGCFVLGGTHKVRHTDWA